MHVPLEARVSNAESNTPKEEPSNIEDRDPQILLEPEGVKFVLGPTPVQKQLMEKEKLEQLGRDRSCLHSHSNEVSVVPATNTGSSLLNAFFTVFPQSGIAFPSHTSTYPTMKPLLIPCYSDLAASLPNNHCFVFSINLSYNTSFSVLILLYFITILMYLLY